ncbi:MAG: hypothetical protein M9899_09990 [Bdellovibrionaceae bacterium]|nr:hypothetical protein [Pseudobdellovibrionaceae bacterium]
MKFLGLVLGTLLSTTVFAAGTDVYMCLESGQKAMLITATFQESKDFNTPNTAEITEYAPDESFKVTKLQGKEPELGFLHATDEDGHKLVIITSMIPSMTTGLDIRVLVCSPN